MLPTIGRVVRVGLDLVGNELFDVAGFHCRPGAGPLLHLKGHLAQGLPLHRLIQPYWLEMGLLFGPT
jgi:hypothetical protein